MKKDPMKIDPTRRPTSLAELEERFRLSAPSEEERDRYQSFKPESSDIIITPFGKSGTTWLQQIVHGLRTRGDMDFDDISRVVPWIETAAKLDLDLNAPQKARPRAFKSHLDWYRIPNGGRYIVSFRDPKDVLVSSYRFMEGWWFEPGTISIEEWARHRFLSPDPESGYWHFFRSWWEHREQAPILLLCYENMRADLPGTVEIVARFCGIELDDELRRIVEHQSSLPFMLAHKDRFDDRLMREDSEKRALLPPGSDSAKVRKGEVGSYRLELAPWIVEELDAIWRREIEETLGFKNYEAVRTAIGGGLMNEK